MKKPAFTKNRGTESGSGRKQMILRIAIVVAAVAAIVIIAKFKGTGGTVDFTPLTEESIPQQISSEVIPEYRDMERLWPVSQMTRSMWLQCAERNRRRDTISPSTV